MRSLLLFLVATSLFAQEPRYREELTVAEVTVEITVTDRRGNPVTGLTADDFEVREDGAPVAITFFREASAPADAIATGESGATARSSAAGPRTLFIFLDNDDINEDSRHRLFNSLRETSDAVMRDGGSIFLFLWTGKLQAVKPKDAATARELLTQFETDVKLRAAARAKERGREIRGAVTPELVMAMERAESLNLLAALDAAAGIVKQFPGRRIMLLASRGFLLPEPEPSDIAAAMATLSGSLGGLAASLPDGPLFAPEAAVRTGRDAALHTALDAVAAAIANRHGFPVYGLFSGGLESVSLGAGIGGGGIPEPFSQTPSLSRPSGVGSIADLAHRTGGASFGAGSNFGPFLETVARDLNHFYTLAYRTAGELRFRRIEVRPKNREWTVRHREAVVPDDRPQTPGE
jgi:VWFA-related protein